MIKATRRVLPGLISLFAITISGAGRADRTNAARNVDVIVYGSTPGGFCAAIAAAREGASVILLEPTGHVGGVNTGGLSFSDSNQTVRSTVMGLFDEWHTRIEQDYASRGIALPYKVSVKDQSKWTYEPHVAARVTKQMMDEAGVEVLTRRYLQSVKKEGTRITSLVTGNGTFTGRVFIDATYEGDLMAAAGVSWTIGREGRAEYGESLAGRQYPKSKMKIDGFDSDGELLPLITTTDAGPEAEGDANVMVYSFRLCLTGEPEIRVPFPEPANYDPARFEVMRRYAKTGGKLGWDLYPLPGGKFDGNNSIGGQFSLGLVGACNGWSEADEAGRAAIWEAHKQYTLEFYHFLTTDPAVPGATRKKYARLGLCRDEFPETGHFSPALYVREGRRMKGMVVVSQKDIMEEPEKEDPIVISSFPIDSHDCQRVALADGGVINEGTIFPVRMKGRRHGFPYHIPYRAILPKPEECSNLLVPVALSCTHVGISSIRVEPTWMILGQSAGIAAALAVEEDTAVQDLPYPKLRERLLARGQVLDLPELPAIQPAPETNSSVDPSTLPGIVLDDSDAELKGPWKSSTNFKPHIGSGYVHDDRRADGNSQAVFRFRAPKAGAYDLRMAYSVHETRATRVPVVITSGSHEKRIAVDQTQPLPAGQPFRSIDTVELEGEVETLITINNNGTDGFVIVDALQLLPVEPEGEDFISLFNGKDLAGWDGDPRLWKVENGIVVGTCLGPDDIGHNTFLIWRGGKPKDFELRATIRVAGDNNSGIQYRSRELPEAGRWAISGYQCDVHPAIEHTGMTYEEKGRGIFGLNGRNVLLDPEGARWLISEHEPVKVDVSTWNEFTVIARGNHLVHKVNGKVTSELFDHDEKGRAMEGLLAIQLHRGNPNRVEIKDLRLKPLAVGKIPEFDPAELPAGAKKIERPGTSRPQGTGPVIAPAKKK